MVGIKLGQDFWNRLVGLGEEKWICEQLCEFALKHEVIWYKMMRCKHEAVILFLYKPIIEEIRRFRGSADTLIQHTAASGSCFKWKQKLKLIPTYYKGI